LKMGEVRCGGVRTAFGWMSGYSRNGKVLEPPATCKRWFSSREGVGQDFVRGWRWSNSHTGLEAIHKLGTG
jgi:hypothetical protein